MLNGAGRRYGWDVPHMCVVRAMLAAADSSVMAGRSLFPQVFAFEGGRHALNGGLQLYKNDDEPP